MTSQMTVGLFRVTARKYSREGLTDCELYIVGEKGVHVHNWDREDPLRDILKRVEINYWPHHSSQGEEEYSE